MAFPIQVDTRKMRLILTSILNPDNDVRKNAEKAYEEIDLPERIFMLTAIVLDERMPLEEAEFAAIFFRRLIVGCCSDSFFKLSEESQLQVKGHLLLRIQGDTNQRLREKIGDIAAELARKSIDEDGSNNWPEFRKFLFDCSCSPDPNIREVSLLMFSSLPRVFGTDQEKYLEVIHQMLCASLSNREHKQVCYAAVKATAAFLLVNEKEVIIQKLFNDCLNLVLQVLNQVFCTTEEAPEDILKSLVDLAGTCPHTFRVHLDFLFILCIKGLSTPEFSESCRSLSLELAITLCEEAPAMVRKLAGKHLPGLIREILKIMTELEDDPDWDFADDVDTDDSADNPVLAEASLDRMACALGGKTVLPLIMNNLSAMLRTNNWKDRYAAMMAISAVGEGCHKQMLTMLPTVVDAVVALLLDPISQIRYAASNAIGQMSTDFAPIFQKKFHDKVIYPLLETMVDERSPRVQAHSGAALVNFFEDCPKNVLTPYLNKIVERLDIVFNSKLKELVEKGTKMVLEQVVVTLATLADTVEDKFRDYYEKFMPSLKYIIQNATSTDLRLLRGKTIECVSLIGLAVGKEKFLADASDFMELLLKTQSADAPIQEDDPQLSYMIAAGARICQILGKGFEPYLPYVMQPVLKAAAIKPEVAFFDDTLSNIVVSDGLMCDGSDGEKQSKYSDWEFVDLGEQNNFGIRTSGLDEKANACHLLVFYARELKEGFVPYVKETVELMVPLLKFYFHDGVRISAAEILSHLLESAKVRGEAFVQEMWKFILPSFLQALVSEPEPEILCENIDSFSQCISVFDCPCIPHDDLVLFMNFLDKKLGEHFEKYDIRVLKRKDEDYDEIMEETLLKEHDEDSYLLCKISHLLSALFSAYKQDFFPYFDLVLPQFVHLIEANRPCSDRQWSLCVFADVIEHGGPACLKYHQHFLQHVLSLLNDNNADLRQTASYTMGVLGQFGGPEFSKICLDCIPLLIHMINGPNSRSEENVRATENAISAVTKFLAFNNSLINKAELIPLWISWLPIWEDEDEAMCVYSFLCSLLEMNDPILLGNNNCNLPRIVQIVAEAFLKEAILATSCVGKRIVNLMKTIQINGDLFNLCVSQLTLCQQQSLHAALIAE